MIEEHRMESQISDIAKYLAIQESWNKDGLVCRCMFHFGTSFCLATKDEIIKNTCKKTFTTSYRERCKVPAEAYHMGKWLGYTVEFCSDGQWFNIDQWHRAASGKLRHRYLYAAPERDILSSPYDELAFLKKQISFSDLAVSTQDIICAENPAFERSSFGAWDFFIWGSLADLEALLQKPVKNEDDKCISKTLLKDVIVQDKRREPAGWPCEISEFVQWLVDGVRGCIEMLKAGTYNDFVRENLPPQHRTGTIWRRDLWNVWPDARVDFFKDISPADVAEFIEKASAQEENYTAMKERLPTVTANDFFRFCAMGYAENNYDGCGKTPKEQYYLHADGRDDGLQDVDANSPEAFHAWLHDRDRCGGHPWEVCRGGNSTHVDLRVMEDDRGYFLYLAGAAWNRTMETVKFYLALTRANIPVYLAEAKMLADRLAEEEKIGIVPEGVLPAYCGSWFPNEHIIDYMNLPSEDREKFLPFCTWYEEKPAALAQREKT